MAKRQHCTVCDREIDASGMCELCRLELARPIHIIETPAPQRVIVAPRVGLHVAGQVIDGIQVCARCGDTLATMNTHVLSVPRRFLPWPEGAAIERGRGWQAEYFGSRAPSCGQTDEDAKMAVAAAEDPRRV